jgi:hypothetical protein
LRQLKVTSVEHGVRLIAVASDSAMPPGYGDDSVEHDKLLKYNNGDSFKVLAHRCSISSLRSALPLRMPIERTTGPTASTGCSTAAREPIRPCVRSRPLHRSLRPPCGRVDYTVPVRRVHCF